MTGLLLGAGDPLNHVVQHNLLAPGGFVLLSNQIIMMFVAAGIVMYFLPKAALQRAGTDEVNRHVPTGWGNAIEFLCSVLREHVVRPAFGPYSDRFAPYIWSIFFFVATCNLLGMLPLMDWFSFVSIKVDGHKSYVLGGTATGNIYMTGTLAFATLLMIVVNGTRLHGAAYWKHFMMGPPGLNLFIALLELIGLVVKAVALAIRLFANMVAGHVLLAVIVGAFAAVAGSAGTLAALGVGVPVVLGAVAIFFLEIFVALLQAFIFTFLSAMFIGQAVNMHHDHPEELDEVPDTAVEAPLPESTG